MEDATLFHVRKSKVFQDEKPCQLVNSYHRFGEALCLHIQGSAVQEDRENVGSKTFRNVGQCILMHQFSKDWNLHQHHCENLKSRMHSSCTTYQTIAKSNGTHKQNMCTSLMCSYWTLGLKYTPRALRDSPLLQTSLSYSTPH